MVKFEAWVKAFRLRTLPLSMSSVLLGSLLALHHDKLSVSVLIGALVTTLFLQILSNLANDYGDSSHGVDNDKRTGPVRGVQSGAISPGEMRIAILIFTLLALVSGVWLLLKAADKLEITTVFGFFILGILAIAAAIKYTVGKSPYGYAGFGDVAVFIFFGIAGVAGTYFLHTGELSWAELLPAVSIGLLATGVLNLNNIRDFDNDKENGKRSFAVIIGLHAAKVYHTLLIATSMAAAVGYTLLNFQSGYQFIFLITLPILIQNLSVVWNTSRASDLDAELKKLAFATLLFALTMGIGLVY
ncbi:MAG: 1,4-dihydroxy-2-naphthoate polyprenyltransferase [Cryomorphaceae bacterium]|nr:1,4-dihydroxy-2-naphthoate polyprenyltransferase [Flavobacteriales bacterium]